MLLKHIKVTFNFGRIHCISHLLFCFISLSSFSQTATPEFPKGIVGYLGLQQGLVSNFQGNPSYYQIGAILNPQYTVVPAFLRLGVQAGGIYAKNQWNFQAGPTAHFRLFDVKAGSYGTILNLQLMASHLWGSYNEKLIGGGILTEIFQLVELSFTGYRDYGNNQWWLQSTIAYNIFRPRKKSTDPFQNP